MHNADFELIEQKTLRDGTQEFTVLIKAANLTRKYVYSPSTDRVHLEDEPLLVAGNDMTSIIGKRVREWLRSTHISD